MANLLLRDLDEKVLQRLKAAAKAHRRSLQAEIRGRQCRHQMVHPRGDGDLGVHVAVELLPKTTRS